MWHWEGTCKYALLVLMTTRHSTCTKFEMLMGATDSSSLIYCYIPSFRQDFCNLTLHSSNMSNVGNLVQGVAMNTVILLGEFIKFDNGDHDNFDNDNEQMRRMTLNPNYPGLVARLMDKICLRAGCSWRNNYSIIGAMPPNTTWSELLIWTTETYDISVEWWMRSTERMRHGAAFIEPWYVSSYASSPFTFLLFFLYSFTCCCSPTTSCSFSATFSSYETHFI